MFERLLLTTIGLLLAMGLIAPYATAAPDNAPTRQLGGCGGLYLLAGPGELWVEIEKQDLNIKGRRTHLRAILLDPGRRVIDEQWLPDDGQKRGSGPGPLQHLRLTTSVPRKGIYAVNITVTEDRYGEDFTWGFRTNCPRYLVETSRGHRDARHEEPLVLMSPDAPGDVCFLPQQGQFSIEVSALPSDVKALTLYGGDGNEAGTLEVSPEGTASGTFESITATVPWRLHLPRFKGVVNADGLTRWAEREGGFANLSLWTPNPESWFAFHENRWLITPYSRTVYAEPGAKGSVAFEVHNNSPAEQTIALSLEFPAPQDLPAKLSVQEITLSPNQSTPVSVDYRVPESGETWECFLRATPSGDPEVTTCATLEVRRGIAPATQPIDIPLVLKPYQHENEQFGYTPAYPLTNEVYFDARNAPAVSSKTGISVYNDGAWTTTPLSPALSKVAFDRDNGIYTIGHRNGAPALLHSSDGGVTYTAYPIPGNGAFDIEQFSGHNLPGGPPPFIRFTRTAKDPKIFWRSLNDLDLFLPEKKPDGSISIGDPILLTKKCIGFSAHSGIPSCIVSRGPKVHVAWAEATEPEENAPGVPTFVATYDRATNTLGAPALVGYGPPANDVHNTPCITMDSQGYLHILIGTHGRTFRYARSLQPNDAAGGWTTAEDIGPGLRQTYVGLVCDQDDTLHTVFRLWRNDRDYFPASHYATLAYMSKRPGEAWSEPKPLIIAPFSEYSIFYHRLTINRTGQLFLSYDYWSTFWFYRTDHRGARRALLTSPDQGANWKLADIYDILPRETQGATCQTRPTFKTRSRNCSAAFKSLKGQTPTSG